MKDLNKKPENYARFEFWAVTTIFVFAVFFFITEALNNTSNSHVPNKVFFDKALVPFGFFGNYFIPMLIRFVLLYTAFLFLNFSLAPKLIRKDALTWNILLVILTWLVAGLVLGLTEAALKSYLFTSFGSTAYGLTYFFQNSFLFAFWLLLIFLFYTVLKYLILYFWLRSEAYQAKYKFITRNGLNALGLWLMCLFLMVVGEAPAGIVTVWAVVVPCGILFYWLSFHSLIPNSLVKKNPFMSYFGRSLLVLILSYFPISFIFLAFIRDDEPAFAFGAFNLCFQMLITVPLSWILFKRHIRGREELYILKKELGQSNANFDFLRSQINPHFLFNALNTLYGTALQEGAERTGEGITKLGSMMRFMLQENMQDKISLAREIEYLNNYISLQKLRTDPSPAITIQVAIEETVNGIQVAPMLLIPFVENAFKHGISFREPSNIRIALEVKDKALYFDVHNSKHVKQGNDPERDNSGIGLTNVKQRLQLLYPLKHELVIRETGKDFFVHLTIQTA